MQQEEARSQHGLAVGIMGAEACNLSKVSEACFDGDGEARAAAIAAARDDNGQLPAFLARFEEGLRSSDDAISSEETRMRDVTRDAFRAVEALAARSVPLYAVLNDIAPLPNAHGSGGAPSIASSLLDGIRNDSRRARYLAQINAIALAQFDNSTTIATELDGSMTREEDTQIAAKRAVVAALQAARETIKHEAQGDIAALRLADRQRTSQALVTMKQTVAELRQGAEKLYSEARAMIGPQMPLLSTAQFAAVLDEIESWDGVVPDQALVSVGFRCGEKLRLFASYGTKWRDTQGAYRASKEAAANALRDAEGVVHDRAFQRASVNDDSLRIAEQALQDAIHGAEAAATEASRAGIRAIEEGVEKVCPFYDILRAGASSSSAAGARDVAHAWALSSSTMELLAEIAAESRAARFLAEANMLTLARIIRVKEDASADSE